MEWRAEGNAKGRKLQDSENVKESIRWSGEEERESCTVILGLKCG